MENELPKLPAGRAARATPTPPVGPSKEAASAAGAAAERRAYDARRVGSEPGQALRDRLSRRAALHQAKEGASQGGAKACCMEEQGEEQVPQPTACAVLLPGELEGPPALPPRCTAAAAARVARRRRRSLTICQPAIVSAHDPSLPPAP